MDKAVNAGDNSGECAESGDTHNLGLNNIAYLVSLLENCPGIVLVFSVAERNLFVFGIKGLDEYFNFLTDGENLGRILDSLPGHFGNVNHTVNAADIHECAVVGH